MNRRLSFVFAAAFLPLSAIAQSIFNVPQAQPQQRQPASARPTPQAPAQVMQQPQYQPVTPPAASAVPLVAADPKVMAQFDRYPNESDDAFIARMKVIYQRSIADMERASRAHIEKMKALSAGSK
jgi:hypothetical protein